MFMCQRKEKLLTKCHASKIYLTEISNIYIYIYIYIYIVCMCMYVYVYIYTYTYNSICLLLYIWYICNIYMYWLKATCSPGHCHHHNLFKVAGAISHWAHPCTVACCWDLRIWRLFKFLLDLQEWMLKKCWVLKS